MPRFSTVRLARAWKDTRERLQHWVRTSISWAVLMAVTIGCYRAYNWLYDEDEAMTGFLIEVAIAMPVAAFLLFLISFLWDFFRAPANIYYEQQREIENLKHLRTRPLELIFNETTHRHDESNGHATMFRLAVRNNEHQTIANVSLRIDEFQGPNKSRTAELQKYVGLKLAVSEDPHGPAHAFRRRPESAVSLHGGDRATFDFVRLVKTAKNVNFTIWHASVIEETRHTQDGRTLVRYEPSPQQEFPAGKHKVTVSACGHDLEPVSATFEFWTSSRSITFKRVD